MTIRLPSAPTLTLALGLAACSTTSAPDLLTAVSFSSIPGWGGADQSAAFAQFRRQCGRLSSMPADEALGGTGLLATAAGTAGDEQPACLAARQATVSTAGEARRFFETWFAAYRADDLELAGYFEPEFPGSAVKTAAFSTPVLGRPSDLVTVPSPDGHGVVSGRARHGVVVPYDERAAIERGALEGRAPVIAWVRDRVDLYLLQKEGAGRIVFADGSVLRLGYAGQNGAKPAPIGDALVAAGLLPPDDVTSASIRAALEQHPSEAASLIDRDPNYVFFRVLAGTAADEGPPGTLGVDLAPLHSLGVDRHAIPLGVSVFLAAGAPLDVLAFAEDEGGDIKGPDRADLFFGAGELAGRRARALHERARAFVLLPRPLRPAS